MTETRVDYRADGVLHLEAELMHPVGINRTYRTGPYGWYKSAPAVNWHIASVVRLRRAGFRAQPEGAYWIRLSFELHTVALDADGPLKLAIDAVSEALAIDDRWVGEVEMRKVLVRHRIEQKMMVRAELWRVADRDEWERVSKRRTVAGATE